MKQAATKPDPCLAAWCAALAEPSIAAEQVPAGWFTIGQLADETGREYSTIGGRMRDMVRRGKAETRRFRVMTRRGVYPVPHYRLK
jgi:hypothetical protein